MLGGDFQARLCPEEDSEVQRCHDMGISNPNKIFTMDELVKSEDVIFAATGITDFT
jgi:fructose-1,6-bisphosphatase II